LQGKGSLFRRPKQKEWKYILSINMYY
jgi:hypothetical protein